MKEQTNIDLVIIDAIRKIAEEVTEGKDITYSVASEIYTPFWNKKEGTKKTVVNITITKKI